MPLPERFEDFVKPSVCHHEGCGRSARWILQVRLWAKGLSKESHDPIKMQLTWKVCDEHQTDLNTKDFWTDDTKKIIRDIVKHYNKAEPNFDTAEFMWVPLGILI